MFSLLGIFFFVGVGYVHSGEVDVADVLLGFTVANVEFFGGPVSKFIAQFGLSLILPGEEANDNGMNRLELKLDSIMNMMGGIEVRLNQLTSNSILNGVMNSIGYDGLVDQVVSLEMALDNDIPNLCDDANNNDGMYLLEYFLKSLKADHLDVNQGILSKIQDYLEPVRASVLSTKKQKLLYDAADNYFFTFSKFYFDAMFFLDVFDEECPDSTFEFDLWMERIENYLFEFRNKVMFGRRVWRKNPSIKRSCGTLSSNDEKYAHLYESNSDDDDYSYGDLSCSSYNSNSQKSNQCILYPNCVTDVSALVDPRDHKFVWGMTTPGTSSFQSMIDFYSLGISDEVKHCQKKISAIGGGAFGKIEFTRVDRGKMLWYALTVGSTSYVQKVGIRRFKGSCLRNNEENIFKMSNFRTSVWNLACVDRNNGFGRCLFERNWRSLYGNNVVLFENQPIDSSSTKMKIREDLPLTTQSSLPGKKCFVTLKNRYYLFVNDYGTFNIFILLENKFIKVFQKPIDDFNIEKNYDTYGGILNSVKSCHAFPTKNQRSILYFAMKRNGKLQGYEVEINPLDLENEFRVQTSVQRVYEKKFAGGSIIALAHNPENHYSYQYEFMYFLYNRGTGENEVGEIFFEPKPEPYTSVNSAQFSYRINKPITTSQSFNNGRG